MDNAIGVHSNTYHGFSVDDALEGIALAGFKYVELSAVKNWTEHIMPDMLREERDRIKCKLKQLGLTCTVLSGHCSLLEDARLRDFRKNIQLAHELGCKYITTSVGEAHFDRGHNYTDELLAANIRLLLPELDASGVSMCIETHGEYGTGQELARLCALVDSPLVGICYDTANVVYFGHSHPMTDIKTCLKYVKTVHLKDKTGPDHVGIYPAIGSGDLDLASFIEYVGDNGFNGPFSIEIEFDSDYARRNKNREDLDFANGAVAESFRYLHERWYL